MTASDHARLLATLAGLEHAAAMLSGYRCELYDAALEGWRRVEWDMPNHAGQGRAKQRRTECLGCGPSIALAGLAPGRTVFLCHPAPWNALRPSWCVVRPCGRIGSPAPVRRDDRKAGRAGGPG